MGTHSFIAIKAVEKVLEPYQAICCHWDGYLEHVGRLLSEHYNTAEAVKALLSLGDISSLGERLAPDKGEAHSFESPARDEERGDVTVAYHRDRGEDLHKAQSFYSERALRNAARNSSAEYLYLFDEVSGEWSVAIPYHDSPNFFLLADKLAELG